MKIIIFNLFSLVFVTHLPAQDIVKVFGNVTELSGKPLMENTRDIEGTPMLSDRAGEGTITLKNGKVYNKLELLFNVNSNELYFEKEGKFLLVSEPLYECTVTFNYNGNNNIILLRSGYPASGNGRNDATLYQVVADGSNVQLLKFLSKKIDEISNYNSGKRKVYVLKETYYLYDVKTKQLSFLKPGKNAFIEALPSYQQHIQSFLSRQPSKLRDETDWKSLISELNKID